MGADWRGLRAALSPLMKRGGNWERREKGKTTENNLPWLPRLPDLPLPAPRPHSPRGIQLPRGTEGESTGATEGARLPSPRPPLGWGGRARSAGSGRVFGARPCCSLHLGLSICKMGPKVKFHSSLEAFWFRWMARHLYFLSG